MSEPTFGLTITRVDDEPRPAVFADMSICGIIGTAPLAAADTKATLTILGAANAGLVFTSKLVGVLGNAITIAFVNPGTPSAVLGVVVTGNAIVVNLATSAGSVVTTTATMLAAAIVASGPANALVQVANAAGSSGAGLVAASPAAALTGGKDEPFPLNTPVFIFSGDTDSVDLLGTTGTLRDSILLLNAQLGEFQSAARLVIVRVAAGVDDAATIANIVGNGTTTGIAAFLEAGPKLGFTPRLLAAPGYTHQRTPPAANAVCAALPSICTKLLAHAVVGGPATTMQDALDWRETMASERLIPVDPKVKVYKDGAEVVQPIEPAVLGIAVRRDFEKGGRPFHSWANQPINGIVGPSRSIRFSLTDGATEGQALLESNIGITIRGENGVSGSLADGGFVFIGTDNAGADDLWRFYNVTRGRDYIHLMLLDTLRFYLGKFNITAQTVQAIINTMNLGLRGLKAEGDLLGYRAEFIPDRNSAENIRQGRIVVSFQAEEAPVLRHIGIRSARMRSAVDDLIANLATAA